MSSVLMGDFNAVADSRAITALMDDADFIDAFRSANPTLPGPTVWQRVDAPAPMVSRRADYLFVIPGVEVAGRVLSSRVVLNAPRRLPNGTALWPSDYYGVLAEVEVSLVGQMICADACRLDQGPCARAGGPGLIWTATTIDSISDCVHN
ncbi:MAG: hypothetical protein ACHQ7N_04005 [Candidatus Methylomirabilales bacterium]